MGLTDFIFETNTPKANSHSSSEYNVVRSIRWPEVIEAAMSLQNSVISAYGADVITQPTTTPNVEQPTYTQNYNSQPSNVDRIAQDPSLTPQTSAVGQTKFEAGISNNEFTYQSNSSTNISSIPENEVGEQPSLDPTNNPLFDIRKSVDEAYKS